MGWNDRYGFGVWILCLAAIALVLREEFGWPLAIFVFILMVAILVLGILLIEKK